MTRPKPPPDVDLARFGAASEYARNRLLIEWLGHDGRRAQLYDEINRTCGGVLPFPSLAQPEQSLLPKRAPRDTAFRTAYLVTQRDAIEEALRTPDKFSNAPYADLGTGGFMLSLDPQGAAGPRRQFQIDTFRHSFQFSAVEIGVLSNHAFAAVLPTALGRSEFDLAALAEEAATRFCAALFGFAAADFPLLQDALRKGYSALNYQILGRHFVSDPTLLPAADSALARLLQRTATLIDEFQIDDPERPREIEGGEHLLPRAQRILSALAHDPGNLTGQERAVLAVGSMVGIVGNVQASVCIALHALLAHAVKTQGKGWDTLREKSLTDASGASIWPWLAEGLRLNPPVAFLPRVTLDCWRIEGVHIPKDAECILALGGATRSSGVDFNPSPGSEIDPLVFGLDAPKAHRGIHWCLGKHLAEPLIRRICAGVLRLPGLAQQLHPVDGLPVEFEKQWGFGCTSLRLRHRRDTRFVQQPLNVVMRIKTPTASNAQALAAVIRHGAPRIEAVLRESRHVHFAWFEFIDNDSQLVLHTVFDGDFDAYLQHFALVVGDVFDRLFQYIEGAPPLPVNEFPHEFVMTIRRFHRPAAAGYFFSAYPQADAAQITRWCRASR